MAKQILCRRRSTVPSVPVSVSAAGGNTQATVSFTVPVTNGGSTITGYTATSSPGSFTGTGAASPITVAGLTNGVAYTFTVHATNGVGNSAESAASNSATPSNPATVPGAPTMGTATAGNGATFGDYRATITFTPPGSDGGSAILDYTATSNPAGVSATGAGSPIVVTGLPSSQLYSFTVTARNAVGSSGPSAVSNSVTPISVANAPGTPTAVAGNTSATLTFSGSSDNGGSAITGYTATSNPGGITATGFSPLTVTGLTNGTLYSFTVKANNAAGQSASSGVSNSVTPTLVAASVTTNPTSLTKSMSGSGKLEGQITANVANGAGPFLYSWSWVSGGAGLSLLFATTSTVTVSGNTSPPAHYTGTARVTVTDQGNSNATCTADATVDFTWN